MCSGRVDPSYVVEALASGVDGVLVLGCHLGDCHYISGNYEAKRRMELLSELFKHLHLNENRIRLDWVSASEGERFAMIVREFVDAIKKIGPLTSEEKSKLNVLSNVISAERLKTVLGSAKRALETNEITEEKYKSEMLKIADEETQRYLIIDVLKRKGALTVEELSKELKLPSNLIWRQIKGLQRKRMLELAEIKDNAPKFRPSLELMQREVKK